jgi:hypothetical protein
MSSFNRELFSLTSAMPELAGGALGKKSSKKHGSKKGSKKHSSKKSMKRVEKMEGGKKHGSKKGSKKHSKKSSRKQSRGMPQFMVDLLAIKREVKTKHTDIKDGAPLSKVASVALKEKGSVAEAVKYLNNMSSAELKSKLDKVAQEIAEKRASKKAARMSAQ